MSIGGITGPGNGAGGIGSWPARPSGVAAERSSAGQAAEPSPKPAAAAEHEGALPMQAPAGVDPALWSVLTAEERQFFGKLSAMGPLTYGPRSANVPPAMIRGGRIDRTV